MTKVIIDKSLRLKLIKLKQQAELCDESGQTIGVFFPYEPREMKLPPGAESPISDEELERRRKEPGGCSLAEIWAELEKKSCNSLLSGNPRRKTNWRSFG